MFQEKKRLSSSPNAVSLLNVQTICNQVLNIYKRLFTPLNQINTAYIHNKNVFFLHTGMVHQKLWSEACCLDDPVINKWRPITAAHTPCACQASRVHLFCSGGKSPVVRFNVKWESWAVCLDILGFAYYASFTHSPVQKSIFTHNRLVCWADRDSA